MPTALIAVMHIDDRDFTGSQPLRPDARPMTGAPLTAAPLRAAPPPVAPRATAPNPDWDLLFNAVTARLRRIAGVVAPLPGLAGMPQQARGQVLECAEALDQLHDSMSQQQALQNALQQQLDSVHGDLAQTRAALDCTRHSAQHDALTTLPNREHFRDVLGHALMKPEHAVSNARPDQRPTKRPSLAVLYLDLDGFKPINDQHGHAVGDRMLRIVATRLTRAVRAGDCVGRMGGDEFACLLAGVDNRQQLSHLACKLFDTVSAPLQIGKLQLTVRPSIGIAVCPTDGCTAETLLKRSDAAMYRAKRAQSGYAFFERRADLLT